MANIFKQISAGSEPLASDVDQLRMAFSALADVGVIGLAPVQTAPNAPSVSVVTSASGNLNGAYKYQLVLATGWVDSNSTTYINGFAPGAESTALSVTNGKINVSIPSFSAPVVGVLVYRTAANGASGSEQFCGAVFSTSITTFTDNVADGSLGSSSIPSSGLAGNAIPTSVPTSNTTGTTLQVGSAQFWNDVNCPSNQATSGYQKLNNTIFQWCSYTCAVANTQYFVNFPIAFPSGCTHVLITVNSTGAGATASAYNYAANGCYVICDHAWTLNLFAIGW